MTRSLGCILTKRSFGKVSNPILQAVSPVSQNLYVESLNQFYIFLAGIYTSFGHSAFFRNPYGNLSHLRAKYGKSPQKIELKIDFHFAATQIFTECFDLFGPNISA